jgi:3-oxoacyl-(acyl-carrier-protein) synthase
MARPDRSRAAVVTGIGIVAPGSGSGARGFWDLLVSGATATGPVTLFDPSDFRSRVAAEVTIALPAATAQKRAGQFLRLAAREAIADSGLGLVPLQPGSVATVVGSALSGLDGATTGLWRVVPGRAMPVLLNAQGASADDTAARGVLAAEAAAALGSGPALRVGGGDHAGTEAVARAMRLIEAGRADVVLAGAAEAPITPMSMAAVDAVGACSRADVAPQLASRPFDLHRDGFVLGEGAAVLVIEEASAARHRGARIYAELIAAVVLTPATFPPDSDAAQTAERRLALAVTSALRQARLDPQAVGYVSAHGTGGREDDRREVAALKRALGQAAETVPVSSIKAAIGHGLGAAGALQLAAAALSVTHAVVPPTATLLHPDPECDLDHVRGQAQERRLGVALATSGGLDGARGAVLLGHPDRRS